MSKELTTAVHISAGRYSISDKNSHTFQIWKNLSYGFKQYIAFGRSDNLRLRILKDSKLVVILIPSIFKSELEFLFTQLLIVPLLVFSKIDVVVTQCAVKGGIAALIISRIKSCGIYTEIHGNEYFINPRKNWKLKFLQKISKFIFKRSHVIRVLSPTMKLKILEHYSIDLNEKIKINPPRVNLKVFNNKKKLWEIKQIPKIIMVGTINNNKGQLRLLKVLEKIHGKFEITFIGKGPDRELINNYINKMGISGYVKFTGFLNHVEIVKELVKNDICIFYSRTEALPRALLEAMAVGLPVISTNVGFISDVIRDQVDGVLIKSENDMLYELEKLLKDESLRTKIGENAMSKISNEYDSIKLYKQYIEDIKSAIYSK
jgi:glycosyltransferase involved in cell wall biosynthesis